MALLYERAGRTRMQGRIMALLMLSDRTAHIAGEIAAELQASKASVSTNNRMFVAPGLTERFTRPPDRGDDYQAAGATSGPGPSTTTSPSATHTRTWPSGG